MDWSDATREGTEDTTMPAQMEAVAKKAAADANSQWNNGLFLHERIRLNRVLFTETTVEVWPVFEWKGTRSASCSIPDLHHTLHVLRVYIPPRVTISVSQQFSNTFCPYYIPTRGRSLTHSFSRHSGWKSTWTWKSFKLWSCTSTQTK
jgi:hypothetical protein